MPRNGSGVYSLPEPAFQSQTPISSTAMNSDMSDIATALTSSLPRDGQAGMTSMLPLAADGFNYTIDPNTGMKRSGPDEQIIYCGGTDVVKITPTGIVDGVTGGSLGFVIGVPYLWTLPTAPIGCVFPTGQECTSSYPIYRALLIAGGSPFGTYGSNPKFPDMRGVVAAGIDSARGILSGATLGAFIGTETVALTGDQNGPHTHTGSGTTSGESNGHTHTGSGTTSGESQGHTHTGSGTTSGASADHTHSSGPASSFYGSSSHGAMQAGGTVDGLYGPYLVSSPSTTSGQSGDHSHTYSLTTSNVSADHTHTYSFGTTDVSADHTHTFSFTTASSGSGTAHANVQPTICLNWIMRAA